MKLIRFLFVATIGAIYGLLFAQRPGRQLRKELKESDQPAKTLFNEFKEVDKEAIETTVEWAKESEDLQNLLKAGKLQFNAFVSQAKKMGTESREIARERLERLAKDAKEAADELKETAVKRGKEVGKEVQKEAKKGIKTIAKKIGK